MIETLCANNVPDTSKIIFLINPFEDVYKRQGLG